MRNSVQTGSKWFVCDNCGFDYPIRYKRTQRGKSFCTWIPCYDKPGGQEESDRAKPRTTGSMKVHVGFD